MRQPAILRSSYETTHDMPWSRQTNKPTKPNQTKQKAAHHRIQTEKQTLPQNNPMWKPNNRGELQDKPTAGNLNF